jgi:general L-amino acid transport system substrate-binding protein
VIVSVFYLAGKIVFNVSGGTGEVMLRTKMITLLSIFMLIVLVGCNSEPAVEEVSVEEPTATTETAAQVEEEEAPAETDAEPVSEVTEEPAEEAEVVEVQEPTASRLDSIRSRGKMICGGNANVAGFGFLAADGSYSGFDIDFCRAVAVAVFGVADDSTMEIRPLTAADRPVALQTNEIDVLIRNTTYTLSRDTEWAADFGPTNFYDGQGMMVRADSGIESLEDLEGGSVCVQTGTTTELNLADVMASLGINYESIVFPDSPTTTAAYNEGTCDGFTTDKSGLISQKQELTNPEEHIILDVTMSKEPLGPAYSHGDNQWGDVVDWSVYCTISGEEYGITSENVDEMIETAEDPNIRRMLGVEGALGEGLGLGNDFCANIIREVGNYAEIYNRSLGPDTPYNVPRGLNNLYTEGGLLYAPPFR